MGAPPSRVRAPRNVGGVSEDDGGPQRTRDGRHIVVGGRRWRASDFSTRRVLLEDARPFPDDAVPDVEPLDLHAVGRATPPQFDDLIDPAAVAAAVGVESAGQLEHVEVAEEVAEAATPGLLSRFG